MAAGTGAPRKRPPRRSTTQAGSTGGPLKIIAEDDGTDPKRGAEVVEKFANQHNCDVAFGTLFSHVVFGSAPAAGEVKIPYYVVSEGHHVASGALNRYTLQPGITDVKSQVQAMAPLWRQQPWQEGHDDLPRLCALATITATISPPRSKRRAARFWNISPFRRPRPPFTKYFPKIPRDTEVLYHVMVGPAVLTFVKELGEFFGPSRPEIFGFIDSLEAVDLASPGLEFLEGTYFWEGNPRYAQANQSEADKAFPRRRRRG